VIPIPSLLEEAVKPLEPNEPIPQDLLNTVTVSHIGPTWEPNPNWNGVNLLGPEGKYILPEFSLGYQAWAWVRENLLAPDSNDAQPTPFTPTFEQYRFVLWWYAVDSHGRFLFRRGVLQRLKGWGDFLARTLLPQSFPRSSCSARAASRVGRPRISRSTA